MCYSQRGVNKKSRAALRHRNGRYVEPLVSMGEPIAIGPRAGYPHIATIVWLPGFTWGAREMVHARLPRLRAALPAKALECVRVVVLCPPIRPISCYGGLLYHAWHDYLSDHGGVDGKPFIEERIDVTNLVWARDQVPLS